MSDLLSYNSAELKIQADKLFEIAGIEVTNTLTTGILITLVVLILGISIQFLRTTEKSPNNFQSILEMLYEAMYGFILQLTQSKKITKDIIPIIGTVFVYVGISNIILTLPILESITFTNQNGAFSFFRLHTSDLSVTYAIALSVVLWAQWYGIKNNGFFNQLGKYIKIGAFWENRKDGAIGILTSMIQLLLLGPLDFVGEFAKTLSLSLRLFGNMLAGYILSLLLLGVLAVVAPAFLNLYGVFAGLLQAVIFGALASSYFVTAVNEESLD